MIIKTKEAGNIEICNAAKNEYGDIEVFSATGFSEISSKVYFPIKSVFLVEDEYEWCLFIDLELPNVLAEEMEPWVIFEIENQDDIRRLLADKQIGIECDLIIFL